MKATERENTGVQSQQMAFAHSPTVRSVGNHLFCWQRFFFIIENDLSPLATAPVVVEVKLQLLIGRVVGL